MPIYMGGRKIKDLYYGGRKIKEAWYNGKKVYTSFVIPPAWYEGDDYHPGDVVYMIDRQYAPGFIFTFRRKEGARFPGYSGPSLYYGVVNSSSDWEFLEKIPVSPYPPENYREYN